MSDKQLGREADSPSGGGLSEADKARIRAEEEYRASIRAEIAPTPLTRQEQAEAEGKRKLAEMQERAAKEQARLAAMTPEQRKAESRRVGCGITAVATILIFGVGWIYSANQLKAQEANAPKAIANFDALDVIIPCESVIEKQLKSPSTAKFVRGADPKFNGKAWIYKGSVDSQNGFGAMIRSDFICAVAGTTDKDAAVSAEIVE